MSFRTALVIILAVLVAACEAGGSLAQAGHPATAAVASQEQSIRRGGALFQRCAACHLVTGKGIPGAFPPLAGRLAKIASSDAGRSYLVLVVSHGLTGPITVNGVAYNGFMPAQNYGFDAMAVADLLNYAMYGLPESDVDHKRLYTPGEVTSIQDKYGQLTQADVAGHRKQALGGDD